MDMEERVSELELEYEELEQQYFLTVAVLFAFIIKLWLGSWFLAITLPITGYILAWKFLAKKPFSKGVPNE